VALLSVYSGMKEMVKKGYQKWQSHKKLAIKKYEYQNEIQKLVKYKCKYKQGYTWQLNIVTESR
jgi:hypothetical protein